MHILMCHVERRLFVSGTEHVLEKMGKLMVMVRAVYGLKSIGAYCRIMFAYTLRDMDFLPTVADPEVYSRRLKCTGVTF